jgi:hypothetical protein
LGIGFLDLHGVPLSPACGVRAADRSLRGRGGGLQQQRRIEPLYRNVRLRLVAQATPVASDGFGVSPLMGQPEAGSA